MDRINAVNWEISNVWLLCPHVFCCPSKCHQGKSTPPTKIEIILNISGAVNICVSHNRLRFEFHYPIPQHPTVQQPLESHSENGDNDDGGIRVRRPLRGRAPRHPSFGRHFTGHFPAFHCPRQHRAHEFNGWRCG